MSSFIQNILLFLIGFNPTVFPRIILQNQRGLTIFGRCEQYTIDLMVYLIGNEAAWAKVNKEWRVTATRRRNSWTSDFWLNGRNARIRKTCCLMDFIYFQRSISLQEKTSFYILKPCRRIDQSFEESLTGGKRVKNLEIFWMNNKSVIEFGCWIKQISEDALPPTRPSATVYNILLDLHYSSHPTQPHSIIW